MHDDVLGNGYTIYLQTSENSNTTDNTLFCLNQDITSLQTDEIDPNLNRYKTRRTLIAFKAKRQPQGST